MLIFVGTFDSTGTWGVPVEYKANVEDYPPLSNLHLSKLKGYSDLNVFAISGMLGGWFAGINTNGLAGVNSGGGDMDRCIQSYFIPKIIAQTSEDIEAAGNGERAARVLAACKKMKEKLSTANTVRKCSQLGDVLAWACFHGRCFTAVTRTTNIIFFIRQQRCCLCFTWIVKESQLL